MGVDGWTSIDESGWIMDGDIITTRAMANQIHLFPAGKTFSSNSSSFLPLMNFKAACTCVYNCSD
jgi:hypothetical protein